MRYAALFFCLMLLAGLAWHSAMRGTTVGSLKGAPQIEQGVHEDVRSAIAPVAGPGVTVATSGRNVTVSGHVYSEAERSSVLERASSVPLLGQLSDNLDVLPLADPFVFTAEKTPNGGMLMSGNVPTRAAEEALLTQARLLAGTAPLETQLQLAAGAPDGEWTRMATQGMIALWFLEYGKLSLNDLDASVEGVTSDDQAFEAVAAATRSAPLGEWTIKIKGIEPISDPFTFSAFKTPDGAIILGGHAPDEDSLERLLEGANALSTSPVENKLTLARGVPGPDWVQQVLRALEVLGAAQGGLLNVSGTKITIEADVLSSADEAEFRDQVEADWIVKTTVLNPSLEADVTLRLSSDGSLAAKGRLPENLGPEEFVLKLPIVESTDFDIEHQGSAVDWTLPLEGIGIIAPRFREATIRISGQSLAVTGKLKRGYSAEGSFAALRSVLNREWVLELDISESAPLAEVILSKQGAEVGLSGVLPLGLDPERVIVAFGAGAGGEGLVSGGEGDVLTWLQTLEATADALNLFEEATGNIENKTIALNGILLPGYDANIVQSWMSERLPEDVSAAVSTQTTPARDGDTRSNLKTGEAETYRLGYWLPIVTFPVSQARCAVASEEALVSEKIRFVTGSARMDQKGRALLNRLSAVASHCLNGADLVLEIGGHTDSVGNDAANQTLSEERARAVREALLARGVGEASLRAIGYGESQPIATNDTAEGRALNRRIAFNWISVNE